MESHLLDIRTNAFEHTTNQLWPGWKFSDDVLWFILTVCHDRREIFISNSSVLEEILFITRRNSRNKATQRHVYHTTRWWTLTLDEILKPPLTNLIQVVIMDNNSFHFYLSIFHTRKKCWKHLWILFFPVFQLSWGLSILKTFPYRVVVDPKIPKSFAIYHCDYIGLCEVRITFRNKTVEFQWRTFQENREKELSKLSDWKLHNFSIWIFFLPEYAVVMKWIHFGDLENGMDGW